LPSASAPFSASLCPPPYFFYTDGVAAVDRAIGGINGIDTPIEMAESHAAFLSSYAEGHRIEWCYNPTSGFVFDLLKVFAFDYLGLSLGAARLLRERWSAFHNENLERPEAKYLQFCHSKGAIDVRIALSSLPPEVRNRVIVVALAPAAIISRELCSASYNYASRLDLVPYGKLFVSPSPQEAALLAQLIILDPKLGEIGHELQSGIFNEVIAHHMQGYLVG
jgi:hypothetical protein